MHADNREKAATDQWESVDAIVGVDFTNAYGKYFRSSAINGILKRLPKLAGMVYSELQNSTTVYWQRVNGSWQASLTNRGGFQGKRL
eukprot:5479148-Karenia_brevis.AAC.1